ncbi:MAG: hypothetical protein ACRD1G_11550, partial [Acidimicrobiales bacterium]
SSGSTLGTPFFPPVHGGLDRMGGQRVGPIADLELGSPEELGVRFGRQDARHPQGFLLGFLADEGRQALGFRFLFRGEDKVGHEQFRGKRGVDFQNPSASGFTVRKTHPLFSCLPHGSG